MNVEIFKDLMQSKMKELSNNYSSYNLYRGDPSLYIGVASFFLGYAAAFGYHVGKIEKEYIRSLNYYIDNMPTDRISEFMKETQTEKSVMGLKINITNKGNLCAKSMFLDIDDTYKKIRENINFDKTSWGDRSPDEFIYLPDFEKIMNNSQQVLNEREGRTIEEKHTDIISIIINNLLFSATLALLEKYEQKFSENFYSFKMYRLDIEPLPISIYQKIINQQTKNHLWDSFQFSLDKTLPSKKILTKTIKYDDMEDMIKEITVLTNKKEELNDFLTLTNMRTITDFGKYYKNHNNNIEKISNLLSKKTNTPISVSDVEKYIESTKALSKDLFEKYFNPIDTNLNNKTKNSPKI